MQFSQAVVVAFIAYGGLAAAHADGELDLQRRDLSPRDLRLVLVDDGAGAGGFFGPGPYGFGAARPSFATQPYFGRPRGPRPSRGGSNTAIIRAT